MATFYDLIFNDKSNWDKELLITNVDRYTLQDFHNKVAEFITLLQAEGDLQGKKVAALIPNLPVYFSLLIAVNRLGGTFIPLNHQFRNDDLTKVLDLIKPHIVFTQNEINGQSYKKMIRDWGEKNFSKTTIFTFMEQSFSKELIQGNEPQLNTEEIDFIACTSGSTGVPKGIKLSVESIKQWTETIMAGIELKENDRIFLTIPSTAPYGICWLLTCFMNRVQMVIPEGIDMLVIIRLLKENPCNKITTTPSIFKAIYLFAQKIDPAILSHFELGSLGGEQLSEEFIHFIADYKNCRFKNSYGLSEVGVLMSTNDIRSQEVEWVIDERVDYKVIDISTDGIGEILFESPYCFDGYYENNELTREAVTEDGWFYSGDLVQVNEQGKFNFVGRKKQMIKKAGVQVLPGEVESILTQHPKVSHAAVVGIPHAVYGEDIVAFVVQEKDLQTEELFAFLRNRIAEFKVPAKIKKINELPIIQGKIDKVTLQKMALDS